MQIKPENQAREIFRKAIEASKPSARVKEAVKREGNTITVEGNAYSTEDDASVYVIAVGKASREMASALKEQLMVPDDQIICITPEAEAAEPYVVHSTHPVPDEKSVQAANRLLTFIDDIPQSALVCMAISGGTSALLCKPAGELQLLHLNEMNRKLLESGATIHEINCVRKHLSAIKGGQLLKRFNPRCTLVDLVISDVPGDDRAIIGSGPTTPDRSAFTDAKRVLQQYGLWEEAPEPVHRHIEEGVNGSIPETLKPGEDPLHRHDAYIISSAGKFARKAGDIAGDMGYAVWVAEQAYNEPAGRVAEEVLQTIEEYRRKTDQPQALIFYGESTVEVTGDGKGGRNQELALRGAMHIAGKKPVVWLSAGTDGIDGPTDAAGAVVTNKTIEKSIEMDLDAREYLRRNDAYHFHQQVGTLFKTGPTGNNVMDVVVILLA